MNTARQANPALGWMIFLLIAVVGLFYHTFAAPILHDGLVPLVALGVVAAVALFWRKV